MARLQKQVNIVIARHEKYLADGFGSVYLPYALERKYPRAAKETGWQYLSYHYRIEDRKKSPNQANRMSRC
jgi:hypothetical protein